MASGMQITEGLVPPFPGDSFALHATYNRPAWDPIALRIFATPPRGLLKGEVVILSLNGCWFPCQSG